MFETFGTSNVIARMFGCSKLRSTLLLAFESASYNYVGVFCMVDE